MKKILSIVLTMTMLFSILCVFTYATEEDTPYSGGSGTEEDPYLLSSSEDIDELRKNIETDPSLYAKKIHYKLTADITITEPISPVYNDKYYGLHCLKDTEYRISQLESLIHPWTEEWYGEGWWVFGCSHEDELEANYQEKIWDKMGPPSYYVLNYDRDINDYVSGKYFEMSSGDAVLSTIDSIYISQSVESFIYEYYDKIVYRYLAFTGVFDGNGHTITANNINVFGFVKNKAEIKNLIVTGNKTALAYSLESGCIVKNCVLDIGDSYSFNHERYRREIYEGTDIPYRAEKNVTEKGIIIQNNATFIQCINYGDTAIFSSNKASADQIIDLSCPDTVVNDEIYTRDECTSAGGDPSAYKDFDFENVWMMVDGMPYLRTFFKADAADVNYDGKANTADSLLLKMHIAGALQENAFTFFKAADLDKNQTLNAADSLLVKRHIAGN